VVPEAKGAAESALRLLAVADDALIGILLA
jgi:hypothetical protein